ncbi:MAG: hypothetical protein LN567_06400 [Rickettsia endosymbiont of Graphium doson]|nr:hypothetical protein [Rickettsia endosymbiont of Graphium doson]
MPPSKINITKKTSSSNHLNDRKNDLNLKLYNAVKQNQEQEVINLLEQGADSNFVIVGDLMSWHILSEAINRNNYNITKILICASSDLDYIDIFGPAICYAARDNISIDILNYY